MLTLDVLQQVEIPWPFTDREFVYLQWREPTVVTDIMFAFSHLLMLHSRKGKTEG